MPLMHLGNILGQTWMQQTSVLMRKGACVMHQQMSATSKSSGPLAIIRVRQACVALLRVNDPERSCVFVVQAAAKESSIGKGKCEV